VYAIQASALQSLADWTSILAERVGLGFDAIVLSLPHQNIFNDQIAADLDLSELVGLAIDRSLKVFVEVPVASVPAGAPEAAKLGLSESSLSLRDPRVSPADRQNLPIPFFDETRALIWLEDLRRRLSELERRGVAGFACAAGPKTPTWIWSVLTGRGGRSPTDHTIHIWVRLTRLGSVLDFEGAGFAGAFLPVVSLFEARQFSLLAKASEVFGNVVLSPGESSREKLERANWDAATLERRSRFLLWLSAALGDGVILPMGFEYGVDDQFDSLRRSTKSWLRLAADRLFDLSEDIAAANAFISSQAQLFERSSVGPIWPVTAKGLAAARDSEDKSRIRVVLANPAADRDLAVRASSICCEVGEYLPLRDALRSEPNLTPDRAVALRPLEVLIFEGRRGAPIQPLDQSPIDPERAVAAPRLVIERVTPSVDGGRCPAKRIVGEAARIEADVYGEGHDPISVALLWRAADNSEWREKPMTSLGNDRWSAEIPLERLGRHLFSIETWRDEFAIYRAELQKKHDAGLPIALELQEGQILLERAAKQASGEPGARLKRIVDRLRAADDPGRLAMLMAAETARAFAAADARAFRLRLDPPVPIDAERRRAGFASWYELFPRSQSGDPRRHGTFIDVIGRLPAIRDMGFDVLYFPPIHPIGQTNRKGRNNALKAGPGDPGSPYAIGSDEGGHDAIHPALGAFEDFHRLISEAQKLDLEIALDFAIQASPDHPWLRQHPEWFTWRPDGTIRYAENPPKKYEDIVNLDFYGEGGTLSLWVALRDTIRFWIGKGVTLFRVDNPHTKPFPFWQWVIDDIRRDHPEVIFLAEAFTRPKVMYRLAKVGFSQSYTYFTWRNTKSELVSYLMELTNEPQRDFFRPHFFVNTPDINPDFLQNAPRSAYLIRAALAATLSGLWGVYNGFEVCEGRPDPQKKEYADSEKYEIRAWDWNRPGNIVSEITALNRIRRANPALHSHLGVSFHHAGNDNVLFFEKATPGRENVVLVAINLDPFAVQEADIELPLWKFGLPDHGDLRVEDLMRGGQLVWTGKHQRVRLDPEDLPFSIWRAC
jgi:starch synthase (maltosyl-transferring)